MNLVLYERGITWTQFYMDPVLHNAILHGSNFTVKCSRQVVGGQN